MFDEQCQSPAERRGVLLVQVDLILDATDENRTISLICRAALEIVFQRDGYLRYHLGLHYSASDPHPADHV